MSLEDLERRVSAVEARLGMEAGLREPATVFVVLRATQNHSEMKGVWSTREAAEADAARLDEQYPRGARHSVVEIPVQP